MDEKQLAELLRNPHKIEEIQKEYHDFYQRAQLSNKKVGKYKGREYINLSVNDHLYVDMGIVINWPNQESPYHIHNWVELSYVFSGTCNMTIKDQEFVLQTGQFVLLDTKTPHSVGITRENDSLINFIFDESYFKNNFFSRISTENMVTKFFVNAVNKQTAHDSYIIFDSVSKKSKELVSSILCEYYDPSICSKDILKSYMTLIICELVNIYQKDTITGGDLSANLLVSDILQYVENNYTDCTLNDLAAEFNLNPSYLTTLLKKQTGYSYKELLQYNRFQQAARLLVNTKLPVREIANEIGYQNIGFFNKKFKNHFGKLPGDYRKKKAK